MIEFNPFIGLPFETGGRSLDKGFDCYGLVRHILEENRSIYLPSYDIQIEDFRKAKKVKDEIAEIMAGNNFPDEWRGVKDIQKYDIVWLRSVYPVHYALAVSSKTFIHIEKGKNSVYEDFSDWKNKILGIYRHDSM